MPVETPAPIASRRAVADERGAIMVLGIFMSVFLVGSLWYIAGIGDTIMYHERMQEAADAVAFSSAVIEARGMNIIVLLNLMMAAILAIRVAINVTKWGLIAAATIFGALSLNPFGGEIFIAPAAAAGEGAEAMQTVDNETKQPIDLALEALHGAEQGVKYATPAAAFGGAQEIAGKYSPLVMLPAAIFGSTIGTGGSGPGSGSNSSFALPVEDGTTDKLCREAFKADGELLQAVFPSVIGGAMSAVLGMLSGIISSIGADDAFCELGGSAPNTQQLTQAASGKICQQQQQTACDAATQAQTNLQNVEAQNGWAADGTPPANPTQAQTDAVNAAQTDASQKQASCNSAQNCQNDVNNDTNGAGAAAQQKVNSAGTTQGTSGNKNPAQVLSTWHNGIDDAQIVGVVLADSNGVKFVNQASKFEQIAAQFHTTDTVKYDSPGNAVLGVSLGPLDPTMNAWAQAEFFYDCSGDWQSSGCNNNDQEAMWNFHWRARFRLVNPDVFMLGKYITAIDAGMKVKMVADGLAYAKKWANQGINVSQAIQGISAAEIGTAVASEPLTLH